MRNELVQCKPGHKCSYDGFHPCNFRKEGSKEHYRKDKYVVRVFFTFKLLEKPFCYPGHNGKHDDGKNGKRYGQGYPKLIGKAALVFPDYHCQDNQHCSICEDSSAHINGHSIVFGNSELTYNRIGYQRMCGKHTCSKETVIEIITQHIRAKRLTDKYRY